MSELIRDIGKLEKLASHQLINQTSGNQEWGTPPEIINAARLVMRSIDLDPASCEAANKVVKAERFFTKADDGLTQGWWGNVWVNWPFGDRENPCKTPCIKERCKKRKYCVQEYQPGNADWVTKILYEWTKGMAYQVTCICFASTSETWFEPLHNFPQCYLRGRTNYIDLVTGEQVKGASKGSVVTYFGYNLDAFDEHFGKLGKVKWPTRFVDRKFFRSG